LFSGLLAGDVGLQVGQQALTRIAVIMAAKGGTVGDVRVGDCLELLAIAAASEQHDMHARSPLFYQLLHARGGWGQDAPAAIQVFSGRGQPSCEQLIDRYRIQCRPVRDVLVDYLRERHASVDFSTLQRLAYLLGKLFWADLEAHHPGIDSLSLTREVAAAWKQRVMTKTRTTATGDGGKQTRVSARLDGRSVMTAVRRSTSTSPSGPTTIRLVGRHGRCVARSAPATSPTRKTDHSASPGWTNGPGNGCRCCRP
jgi:hypothetical protein